MDASLGKWKSQSREIQKRNAPARSMAGSNCLSAERSGRTSWYAFSMAKALSGACSPEFKSMHQSFMHTDKSNNQVSLPAK
jgi:hypothetical protein